MDNRENQQILAMTATQQEVMKEMSGSSSSCQVFELDISDTLNVEYSVVPSVFINSSDS